MKKFSILVTVILFSYFSIAQDCKYECGLQAGPNLTNMRYESEQLQSNMNAQIAGMAGLFFQYNINSRFALRTDPAFERLANNTGEVTFTDTYGYVIGKATTYLHYDYFSIPVLFRASMGNKVRCFVHAGPSMGFLFSQTSISDWPTENKKDNNTKRYKTLNFGLTGGIGAALPIKGPFSLSLELRNNFGFSNINVSKKSNSGIRTNATSLLIGFTYKIGFTTRETFAPAF